MILATSLLAFVSMQDASEWSSLVKQPTYTLKQAIERGLKEAGDGVVYHAELELDDGKLVYSIDVAQGTKSCNVVLDVKDGKILEKETEENDLASVVATWKLSLADVVERAVASLESKTATAIEAKAAIEDRKPVIGVKVFAGDRIETVLVDFVSGEVLSRAASRQPSSQANAIYTDHFEVAADEWSSTGTNPFLVLEPGYLLVLEGKDEGKDARLTITVLAETKKVAGIETRVVEEREEVGGQLEEVSRNYLAISKRTNSVYYFGEDVDMYEHGKVVKHEGAWLAGENGARFGLLMPGEPLIGAAYYQELAPGIAMDRAQVIGLDAALDTPAGKFTGLLETLESSAVEKGSEKKLYARGIGLVREEALKLVKYGRP